MTLAFDGPVVKGKEGRAFETTLKCIEAAKCLAITAVNLLTWVGDVKRST